MKKVILILVLGLVLIYFVALVPNNAEAKIYAETKPDWSKCSGDKTAIFAYIPLFCYGKDGKLLSKNERKIIDKEKKWVTIYKKSYAEIPEHARPNDVTISFYEERKKEFIDNRRRQGRLYIIEPKGKFKKFYQTNCL